MEGGIYEVPLVCNEQPLRHLRSKRSGSRQRHDRCVCGAGPHISAYAWRVPRTQSAKRSYFSKKITVLFFDQIVVSFYVSNSYLTSMRGIIFFQPMNLWPLTCFTHTNVYDLNLYLWPITRLTPMCISGRSTVYDQCTPMYICVKHSKLSACTVCCVQKTLIAQV